MEFRALKMRLIVTTLSLIGVFARAKDNVLTNFTVPADFKPDDVVTDFRLPKNFKPISYTLDITTHLENKFTFEGVVDIRIVCEDAFSVIVLHANSLDIDKERVTIADNTGKPIEVVNVWFSPQVDKMYVSAENDFKPKEEFVLTIPFAGNITDAQVGYYRSSYVDKKSNHKKWLAVTQFEPADARRAFPCFDEPAMKATFKIKLRHRIELTAFSNMRVIKNSPDPSTPHYVVDEFEESVPMSTYLVAYMVSDLWYVQSDVMASTKMNFRIIARRDVVNQTETARNMGLLALHYYERYFDEKFPSSKIDMVGLPECAAGGMENWGFVTFRESAMMLDPKVATIDDTRRVSQIIAHELAHMWFGNIVTMKWWTDLWLKEGFATYVATRALEAYYPKWYLVPLETAENFVKVLELDSLQSSHPVSVPVENPDEIEEIFDTISYKKGSYLVHMMNLFLGESAFKQGIRNYIKKYKFTNAKQDDLWSVLTDEAHRVGSLPKVMTLKEIMDTWTLQTGYPVVKVIRDYDSGSAMISQERFLAIKSNTTKTNGCWCVPLTLTLSSKAEFSHTKAQKWLNCENNENTMTIDKNEAWVIFNVQMAGLYRVMYDKTNWLSIIYTLNDTVHFKNIHTLNRAQLISDALAFSQAGDLDYGITFKLLSYLKHENEYIPWMAAIRGLRPINRLLKRTPNYGIFQAYMRRLLEPLYKKFRKMKIHLNDFEKIRLKNLVISQSCYYRIEHCTEQAQELFNKWMEWSGSEHKLPKELKPTIYCQAVKYGGEEVWNYLWKRYERSNHESEKSKILVALGCSKDMVLLHRYLTWTIGKKATIRKQDAITVFQSVARNDIGYYLAKEYFYSEIKEISKHFHPRGDRVGRYLEAIGTRMKMRNELNEFQLFVNKSKQYLKGTEMSVSQTIETIKINIEWYTKFYDKIVDHIDDGKSKDHKPEFTTKPFFA